MKILFLAFVFFFTNISVGFSQKFDQGSNEAGSNLNSEAQSNDSFELEKPEKKKKRKKTKKRKRSKKGLNGIAIGVAGGWEAIYGNGISGHYFPISSLDIHGGIGYNTSGLKVGFGGGYNIILSRNMFLTGGVVFSHSLGNDGEISLNAKFTPEGSTSSEEITVTKKYTISDSQALSPYIGGSYKLFKGFYVNLKANYNVIVAGNEVVFDDEIKYSQDIQNTDAEAFESEFNDKAEEQASAGGIGFSLGMMMKL